MGKGKVKIVPLERRDFRSDRFGSNNWLRREYTKQLGSTRAQAVHAVFRDPLHQILEKVKNEPFFKWPNRMAYDPHKMQPEPILLIPSRIGARHRRMQEPEKPLGPAGLRGKAKSSLASFKRPTRADGR